MYAYSGYRWDSTTKQENPSEAGGPSVEVEMKNVDSN